MAALSPNQILQLALREGFNPADAQKFTAVVLAESGGNPLAHNPNAATGDNSYGLAQVNMLGGMGPERRKQFGLSSNEELFNPVTNIRAAKRIWDTSGPHAWTTYSSGAYKQFLPKVQQAAGSSPEALPEFGDYSGAQSQAGGKISPEAFRNNYMAALLQTALQTPSMFTPWQSGGADQQLAELAKPTDYFTGDEDKSFGIRSLYMAG